MHRLLADENFDAEVTATLRLAGYDVQSIQELRMRGTIDPEVVRFAHAEGRVVLTFNKWDFIALHKDGSPHSGILVCTRDPDQLALAGRIHGALGRESSMDGKLIRINLPS